MDNAPETNASDTTLLGGYAPEQSPESAAPAAEEGHAPVNKDTWHLMYAADGVEANAVQVNSTSTTELDDGDTIFELSLEPANGSKFWIEFARDESASNSASITFNKVGIS